MQLHISPRHLTLTASIHQHVAGVVLQLEELTEIIAVHCVLVKNEAADPNDRFRAKFHLALPGPDIFGEESAADLHVALDMVTKQLERQLRKRKTRLTDKKRSTAQRKTRKVKTGA
jgi:putative sigma-54 modulation protein